MVIVNTNEALWQGGARARHSLRVSISQNCITGSTCRDVPTQGVLAGRASLERNYTRIRDNFELSFRFSRSVRHVSSYPPLPAEAELKSHKELVPFLAAVSFQAHLSPLISILMVYSCRPVDDLLCVCVCRSIRVALSTCRCVYVCVRLQVYMRRLKR